MSDCTYHITDRNDRAPTGLGFSWGEFFGFNSDRSWRSYYVTRAVRRARRRAERHRRHAAQRRLRVAA